jgi:hypothetical protein
LLIPINQYFIYYGIGVWLYIAIGIALIIYGIASIVKPIKKKYTPSTHMTEKGRRFHPVVVEYIDGKETNYCIYNHTYSTHKEAYNAALNLINKRK